MPSITVKPPPLIPPYGGQLVNLMVTPGEYPEVFQQARQLPAVPISPRAQYDLELLAVGAFSPLSGFLNKEDYQRVLEEMRLANGTLFPLPVTLPVNEASLNGAEVVTLTDDSETPLAILEINEVYSYDPFKERRLALGTEDPDHPLAFEMQGWGNAYAAGRLRVLNLPHHCQSGELSLTPLEVRRRLALFGCPWVVAFQTRNPMHRIHEELTKRAAQMIGGSLLIHPVVGLTKPGDIETRTRVAIYQVLVDRYYDHSKTLLSLLPLAMRLAGPREALWHAIIRRNYGATHLIVGRDHAGPGKNRHGVLFYDPYAAQRLLEEHAAEIGVQPVEYQELVYLADEDRYEEADRVPSGAQVFSISGTQVREEYLAKGVPLPAWFTRPEVAEILQKSPH